MPIPRLIIQTHRSEDIHPEWRQSWRDFHPDYAYRFFNDAQCRALIAGQLPNLLQTYDRLPLPVQKSDLFRYAALYVLGGTYADVDTICCAPLHDYIDMAQDHLVAGVEMLVTEYGGGPGAYMRYYCVPYQLLQWTISASPCHPALGALLHRIRYLVSGMDEAHLAAYSTDIRFTLEVTGPMVFTQVVTGFLDGSQPDATKVTVLPRLAWGAWHAERDNPALAHEIKVKHLFEGGWKPGLQGNPNEALEAVSDKPGADARLLNYRIRLR
ncbi:MAG: hypothetical protein EOO28_23750 [Comamonadaceae bacterium]|nr:MAG: hypothetical protein EOO28_23750 [Comamonadaceae bacterium]